MIRGIAAPTRPPGGAGSYRRTGQGGTGVENAGRASVEHGEDGSVAWGEQDFIEISRRLSELEHQRRAAISGVAPVCEEMDCFRIYFDSGGAEVCGQRDVLDRSVRAISTQEAEKVIVTGHTDRHGSYHENMNLGALRAISVKWLLIVRGVPEDRVECRSAGFTEPRLASDPLAESADIMNRRVEIRISH